MKKKVIVLVDSGRKSYEDLGAITNSKPLPEKNGPRLTRKNSKVQTQSQEKKSPEEAKEGRKKHNALLLEEVEEETPRGRKNRESQPKSGKTNSLSSIEFDQTPPRSGSYQTKGALIQKN